MALNDQVQMAVAVEVRKAYDILADYGGLTNPAIPERSMPAMISRALAAHLATKVLNILEVKV